MSRLLRLSPLMLALGMIASLITLARGKDDAVAEKPQSEAADKASVSSSTDQTAVERALAQPADLDFVETPLKDVAASIAKKSGINVLLDNKAITDAGGSADTPITFAVKRIPLRSALRLMLQEHELNFIVEPGVDNVLIITSDTKAKEFVVTRIYDAHDLTTRPARKFTENQSNLDELIDLITSNVAPTTWSDAGGTGSIIPFGTQLIVSQTAEIHDQVANIFSGLRQSRDVPQKIVDDGGRLSPRLSGGAAEIYKLLGKRRDLDYVETPLKDVGKSVSIAAGVPIEFDLKAMTDAGAALDLPITFTIKNVRLDYALRVMLEEHELNYIIDHEVLLITSDTKAKEFVVTDYYPVGDLIGDTSGKTAKEINDAYESLTDAIKTTIAPTSWSDSGGTGDVTGFSPCKALVCTQTEEIQGELTALLTKLRAGRTNDSASVQPSPTPGVFATRIYQLAPDHADAAADYVDVIRNLIGTKASTSQGAFVGKVPGAIIARCSPATQERIELLLEELQALPRSPLGSGKSRGGAPIGGLGGGGMSGGGRF